MGTFRITILLIFNLLVTFPSFAQKEANIWYFGNKAGLDFNSDSPMALTNNALPSNDLEYGSASIADVNGDLLFYTDGQRILNKNHTLMLNGILYNEPLSRGTEILIVPKPSNPSAYYIFYTGYILGGSNMGLRYSEIDMSLDNGLGGITASKNVILNSDAKNISATIHANGRDIWLVTHHDNKPEFYSYLITSTGINTNPMTSITGPNTSSVFENIKIAPNGKKIVLLDIDTILFDFNNATGSVNNPVLINQTTYPWPYSAEFSRSSNVLYITAITWNFENGALYQYDLNAINIRNSEITLYSNLVDSNKPTLAQLQIGPDHKIYVSMPGHKYISVINAPETLAPECDFVVDGVFLNGRDCLYKLPKFIQSYFYVNIETENVCYGEPTQFEFTSSKSYDNFLWDFGDGYTSTDPKPFHTYNNVGDYTVTLTVTSGLKTTTATKSITIYENPIAYPVADQIVCLSKETGGYFDLSTLTPTILNGQDPNLFNLAYYVKIDGEPFDYAIPFDFATIYPTYILDSTNIDIHNVKITVNNINHPECEDSVFFNVLFTAVPNINQTVAKLMFCDDMSVCTDSDGFVMFDLTQKETEILNGEPPDDFTVRYFKDADLSNEIMFPSQYINTVSNETIYAEVANKIHPECKATTSFKINVFDLPTVSTQVDLKQCDDNIDGFSLFNLSEVINKITLNALNEIITFHEIEPDAISGTTPITNTLAYKNKTVSFDTVWARVENSNGCFKTSQVNLTVTTTQIPDTFIRDFIACDNLSNGISVFDFSVVNAEILAMFPSGQELIINYYRNETDALSESNPIAEISNYSNIGYPYAQDIYVRVDSKIDNDCIGLGAHIKLHVETLPEFTIETPQIVCASNPTFKVVLDPEETNSTEIFSYSWVLNGIEIATSSTLTVSTPGTYSITLTKTNGTSCSSTKDVFVNASELATITQNDVTKNDITDNNTVTINNPLNLGLGNYWFSLESIDGQILYPYQDDPIFTNVKAGFYNLFVEDKDGCGITSLPISVIGYPKFFTPNNDGINDVWQIQGVSSLIQANSTIHIFDRYGNLLKQLSPSEIGWNGTFNGFTLSNDDYWFKLLLQDGRTVLGHFALKR